MLATTWGTGQVLLEVLWFFLLFIEIWLMISIFIDLFRRHDLRGWQKAIWILAILIVPLIGILVYLIFYGNEMKVHAIQASQDHERSFRDDARHLGGSSPSEELARLAELRDRGVINDAEFEQLKARIVQGVS
jgi:Short C-terminal domain/Phospholipase_D-nuclease N-terminal